MTNLNKKVETKVSTIKLSKDQVNDIIAYNLQKVLDKIDENTVENEEILNISAREYLSEATSIPIKRINRILEIGTKRRIPLDEIYKIAVVLKLRFDYILQYDEELLNKIRNNN